ncbi:MAG TPA: Fe-S protein assembly co-chaperone HscB [Acidiferrobacteraceae bacterium]|nr:Fe-S protein assembly co-chaperone HscB [Acidiferrobacteraceae bacterium]
MQADLGKNYFELFEIPVDFQLDLSNLSSRYRELQRRIHPDRFVNATNQERRLSMQMAALVNEAFQTLKDPLERGRYMLGLRGVDVNAETDTTMDPEFLMEQMVLREALSAVRGSDEPGERVTALAHDVASRLDKNIAFLKVSLGQDSDGSLKRARTLVREMQFLSKLQLEVEALEEELG